MSYIWAMFQRLSFADSLRPAEDGPIVGTWISPDRGPAPPPVLLSWARFNQTGRGARVRGEASVDK